jgi:hypothetical protein
MNFSLIEIENTHDNALVLIGRDPTTDVRVSIVVEDFYPYLYVSAKQFVSQLRGLVKVETGDWTAWDGTKLQKLSFEDRERKNSTRRWVFEKKDILTYEGDVDYIIQFKTDLNILAGFTVSMEAVKSSKASYKEVKGW